MLLVLFTIEGCYYGLDTERVVEIVPALSLQKLPGMPSFVSGVFNYRGAITPVIDVSELIIQKPSQIRLSTRIVILKFEYKPNVWDYLGLMGENMLDTIEVYTSSFQENKLLPENMPYLGPVLNYNNKLIQYVRADQLLNERLKAALFKEKAKK